MFHYQMPFGRPIRPKGIDFSNEEIEKARKNNHPLLLLLFYDSSCDLNCIYCSTAAGEYKYSVRQRKLDYENYVDILNQAELAGVKTIFIPGEGEPTLDRNFWKTLPLIYQKGLVPVVFTNGYSLSREQIQILYDNGATIGIKVNSFDSGVQDWLVGKNGYTERREKTLKELVSTGFNKDTPTRLWLDTIVCKQNYNEIPAIHRFCRENNIWSGVNTLFHAGSCSKEDVRKKLDVSIADLKDLWNRLAEITRDEYAKRSMIYHETLEKHGITHSTPDGAFYGIVKLPAGNTKDFIKYMLDHPIDEKTVYVLQAEPFYVTLGLGEDEFRLAFVVGGKKLREAMEIVGQSITNYVKECCSSFSSVLSRV